MEAIKTAYVAVQEAKKLAAQGEGMAKGMTMKATETVSKIGQDGASAATGSYSAMAAIPYIGPILGVIAAAAAIMYGQKQASEAKSSAAEFSGQADGGMIAPRDGSYLMNLREKEHLIPDHMLGDVANSLRNAGNQQGGGGGGNVTYNYNGSVIDAQDMDRKIAHSNKRGQRQFGIRAGRR